MAFRTLSAASQLAPGAAVQRDYLSTLFDASAVFVEGKVVLCEGSDERQVLAEA